MTDYTEYCRSFEKMHGTFDRLSEALLRLERACKKRAESMAELLKATEEVCRWCGKKLEGVR